MTWCPICGSETGANGQCFEALPPLPVTLADHDSSGMIVEEQAVPPGAGNTERDLTASSTST